MEWGGVERGEREREREGIAENTTFCFGFVFLFLSLFKVFHFFLEGVLYTVYIPICI